MIPHFDVYKAEVKYLVRETGGDQELYDIVVYCDELDEEIRIFSDLENDLSSYEKGETVWIAQTPRSQQQSFRLLRMPKDDYDISEGVDRKSRLLMSIHKALPDTLSATTRQKYATTIYLDERNRGYKEPMSESDLLESPAEEE